MRFFWLILLIQPAQAMCIPPADHFDLISLERISGNSDVEAQRRAIASTVIGEAGGEDLFMSFAGRDGVRLELVP
jgi:hypothetical protein